MRTVAQSFDQLLRDLEPTPDERQVVQTKANEIRARLRSGFGGVARDIVTGSIARGTAIRPLNDVDVFLILDQGVHEPPQKERTPDVLLNRLQKALQQAYPGSSVRLQNRSVGLRIPGVAIGFDVVPAFIHPSLTDRFWIPDRQRGDWIYTQPELHRQLLRKGNEEAGGKLNGLIKLLKHWNLEQRRFLRPFYLEAMSYRAFSGRPPGSAPRSYAEGLRDLFTFLAEEVLRSCPDPAGVGPRVDDGATPAERQRRQQVLKTTAVAAAHAVALDQAKHSEDAQREWRKLLGARYPL